MQSVPPERRNVRMCGNAQTFTWNGTRARVLHVDGAEPDAVGALHPPLVDRSVMVLLQSPPSLPTAAAAVCSVWYGDMCPTLIETCENAVI